MDIKQALSPNFNSRPDGVPIDTLILHYTGMQSAKVALARLCDPEAEVSAHYMINEQGEILKLVEEEDRAWHAGASAWRGRSAVNDFSIGIELVNPGHEFGYVAFPAAQMQSLLVLTQEILQRHPIEKRNVIAHSDIAPERKMDPGELFDWKYLADADIGLWAEGVVDDNQLICAHGDANKEVRDMQERLSRFGYAIKIDGIFKTHTEHVVKAFKRHYCPNHLNSEWDEQADYVLNQLLTYC